MNNFDLLAAVRAAAAAANSVTTNGSIPTLPPQQPPIPMQISTNVTTQAAATTTPVHITSLPSLNPLPPVPVPTSALPPPSTAIPILTPTPIPPPTTQHAISAPQTQTAVESIQHSSESTATNVNNASENTSTNQPPSPPASTYEDDEDEVNVNQSDEDYLPNASANPDGSHSHSIHDESMNAHGDGLLDEMPLPTPRPSGSEPSAPSSSSSSSHLPLSSDTSLSSAPRRQSVRMDLKAKAKAALPTIRWEGGFQPPSLEEIQALFKPRKRKREEAIEQQQLMPSLLKEESSSSSSTTLADALVDVKSEPFAPPLMESLPASSDMSSEKISSEIGFVETPVIVKQEEPVSTDTSVKMEMSETTMNGQTTDPVAPAINGVDAMEDDDHDDTDDEEDLFPDLILPNKLYIMKSRLPANLRRMLHQRQYRQRKRQEKIASQAKVPSSSLSPLTAPAMPTAAHQQALLNNRSKSATPVGLSSAGGGGMSSLKKKMKKKKPSTRNEWSGSDDDDDNHSTASDRMLDALYLEDAANAPIMRPKRTSHPSSKSGAAKPQRTPEEQRLWELANFGVDTDEDGETNVNGGLNEVEDGYDDAHHDEDDLSYGSEDDDDTGDAAAAATTAAAPMNAKQRKLVRRADEYARIRLQASMELAERRAYDKAVQNEINDSYAFCDSNPKTMVLSRDSLLIKLDLSVRK